MNMTNNFPFENIVFEGGGVLGVAYQGAWEALEEHGISSQIKRACGTSAGTISATMIALGYTAEDCKGILLNMPFKNFKDGGWLGLWRLFYKYGWYKGDWMLNYFENQLISPKTGNPKSTFRDLQEKGFMDLRLVGTNLTKDKSQIFSYHHTPDMPVGLAMRISTSVPFFFQPVSFNGECFVDGGVLRNYAISEFDKHQETNKSIGFFLKDPNDHPKPITNIISFKQHFMAAMRNQLYVEIKKEPRDSQRTIFIDDLGIGSLDFSILPDRRLKLMEQGKIAAEKFLKNWDENHQAI
jgi:NTE family protein